MDNLVQKIIERIIHIPHDAHIRNISQLDLTKESGYFELHDQIDEDKITEILKQHPHLIKEWIQWSEDKRCTPTWLFSKFDDGECIVSYSGIGFKDISTFDEFKACAAFIKRELETTRKLFTK